MASQKCDRDKINVCWHLRRNIRLDKIGTCISLPKADALIAPVECTTTVLAMWKWITVPWTSPAIPMSSTRQICKSRLFRDMKICYWTVIMM